MKIQCTEEIYPQEIAMTLKYSSKKNLRIETDMSKEEVENVLRNLDLKFYKYKKIKVVPFHIRLTIIFALLLYLLMFTFMPFNFILTGRWGYENKYIFNWFKKVGIS